VISEANTTLGDVGEFELINTLIIPKLRAAALGLGDDCAYIQLQESFSRLAVTSDATPKPLVYKLGLRSYYSWGWYSVLVNVSDLATSGATPLAMVTSVEAPAEMLVSELADFFDGMADACLAMGIPNGGGNIREAPRFECHGTAIGGLINALEITRHGACAGDDLYLIGPTGLFVSIYLKARRSGLSSLSDQELNVLVKPLPQTKSMVALANAGAVSAATDNSDGVLGAFWNIAERSQVGIDVFLDPRLIPPYVAETAEIEGLDPWNLFFYWGDWQQLVAVPAISSDTFLTLAKASGTEVIHVGRAFASTPILMGISSTERRQLSVLRNENFRSYSYNRDSDALEHRMLKESIFFK
jgi:thiamine-monophosphate kinase